MGAAQRRLCVGCCWALMAALFALGVMSVIWMAFVASLIALEKMLPWQRVATFAITAAPDRARGDDVRRTACPPGTDDPDRRHARHDDGLAPGRPSRAAYMAAC